MWAIVTNNIPVPLTYSNQLWVDSAGAKHPKQALKYADFRTANSIVEIIPATPSSEFHYFADAVDSYTQIDSVTWQEVKTEFVQDKQQISQKRKQDVSTSYSQSLNGGMDFTVASVSYPLFTDEDTRRKVAGYVAFKAKGRPYDATLKITVMVGDGQPYQRVSMTEIEFDQYADALLVHEMTCLTIQGDHIEAIELMVVDNNITQTQLIDYDVTVGFPVSPIV